MVQGDQLQPVTLVIWPKFRFSVTLSHIHSIIIFELFFIPINFYALTYNYLFLLRKKIIKGKYIK